MSRESMKRILIFLMVATLGFTDDADKGRAGNKRYHEKKYDEAAALFREGLATAGESGEATVRAGLANNLGCALNRQKSYEQASAAFSDAIQLATTAEELTRSAYNAGNNAFQAQAPDRSLTYYRQALLADPTNEDARFNYEFVRRMMQQQQQQSGGGQSQENQQDQQQEEQQEEQEQQDQQQQDQAGNDSQQEEEQQEEEPTESEDQENMSEQQAEQILQALQNDEEELMRQIWRMKGKPRTVDKDW